MARHGTDSWPRGATRTRPSTRSARTADAIVAGAADTRSLQPVMLCQTPLTAFNEDIVAGAADPRSLQPVILKRVSTPAGIRAKPTPGTLQMLSTSFAYAANGDAADGVASEGVPLKAFPRNGISLNWISPAMGFSRNGDFPQWDFPAMGVSRNGIFPHWESGCDNAVGKLPT